MLNVLHLPSIDQSTRATLFSDEGLLKILCLPNVVPILVQRVYEEELAQS